MDAVRRYKIYFGGSYQEQWSDDYCMTVQYSSRKIVEAEYSIDRWIPVSGDIELLRSLRAAPESSLLQQYFQAAATGYSAVHQCFLRGLTLDRLDECLCRCDYPLVAPELMRILMDDCGFTMEKAYETVARCCDDLRSTGVDVALMEALQPRTARIIGLLRDYSLKALALRHDSRYLSCRKPFGAVRCGENLRLAFRVLGGEVLEAELKLYGDELAENYPMVREGEYFVAQIAAPAVPQALWYCFKIRTSKREFWLCSRQNGYTAELFEEEASGFRLTVFAADFHTPEWFRRSVMYQIFPDRFGFSDDETAKNGIKYHENLGQTPELHESLNDPVRWQPRDFEVNYSPDDFYGGTFKGIEQKLGYLKLLGVNCIYLNPIVEARSNHRYDTSDYHRPDPILGTMEDFENLCKSAEKSGIRLILDGVYSHTGADSRYFNKYGNYPELGACQSESSEFYPWYDFKKYPDEYRCWWGFADLPEVNECDTKWQEGVVTGTNSVVRLWLRHGAAGWRLDVADELPDEVLELIRQSAKAEKPDAPIIGEVWEDAVEKESYGHRRKYALGTALDSVMNYPLRSAVLDFIHGRLDAYELRDFLISQQENYPAPLYYSLMNLMGSHDVERLRTALSTDLNLRAMSREEQLAVDFTTEALDRALVLERLCATIQFAIPGVPSIYYGDEQGMCGVNDPFNRLPFKEGDQSLRAFYAGLAALRNSRALLSTGHAEFMAGNREVLLILRYITDGADALGESADNGVYLAVINRSALPQTYIADCRSVGLGHYSGSIGPLGAEIIELNAKNP